MLKYALSLTGNKKIAKAIVKNCRAEYFEQLAKFGRQQEEALLKISIRKACHNWLYTALMAIINNKKNHPAYPAASTTTRPSVTQNLPQ